MSEEKTTSHYRITEGKERHLQTIKAFTDDDACDFGRKRFQRLGYLEGLRGLLTLLSLIWTFFRIFAPAIVVDRDLDQKYPAAFLAVAPSWQSIFRKVISPVLFNESLLTSFFIVLSARVALQTFLERRSAECIAGPIFRRPFRIAGPASLALAWTSILTVSGAFKYADELSTALSNQSAAAPRIWESTITYFNACVGLLMDISQRRDSRGSAFLVPGSVGWMIPIAFQQTYCVAVMAYMLPYAVLRWKVLGGIFFGLAAWWSGRWVWYSTFAVLLAEFTIAYLPHLPSTWTLRLIGRKGIQVYQELLPAILVAVGVTLKYSWASFPLHRDDELVAHVDSTSGSLLWDYEPQKALPRVDDFFLVAGTFTLIEIVPRLRSLLEIKALRQLGSLGFSSFLTSGSIMLSVGSILHHHLVVDKGWTSDSPLLLLVLFITTVPSSLVFSTLWRFTVDDGALTASRFLYKWIVAP